MGYIDHYDLCQMCIRAETEFTKSKHEVEFLYEETDDFHLVAIRGTEMGAFFDGRGYVDVVRDLCVWPKKIGSTVGHAGFVHGWETLGEFIRQRLEVTPERPLKPIKLTGYSMGGAIAVIGAYDLQRSGFLVSELVTFGAPRSISPESCHEGDLIEVVNKASQYQHVRDPVPARMRWSSYAHLYSIFLAGDKRAPWYRQALYAHDLDLYLTNMRNRRMSGE